MIGSHRASTRSSASACAGPMRRRPPGNDATRSSVSCCSCSGSAVGNDAIQRAAALPPRSGSRSERRQRGNIFGTVRAHQVVVAAGISGRHKPELPRRVAAEKIALYHAIAHDIARSRGDSFVIERRRRLTALQMRLLADADLWRKYLLAQAVDEERRLAIKAASTGRIDVVANQAGGDRRLI